VGANLKEKEGETVYEALQDEEALEKIGQLKKCHAKV
jgi:hypothetical protein